MIITKGVANYGLTNDELVEFMHSPEWNPDDWIVDWDQSTPATKTESRWNLFPMKRDSNYVKLETRERNPPETTQ